MKLPYNNVGTITVPQGVSHHPFEFVLPAESPSSLEVSHGHIRYSVAVVLIYSVLPDNELNFPFTVTKVFDLNDDPLYRVKFFKPFTHFF